MPKKAKKSKVGKAKKGKSKKKKSDDKGVGDPLKDALANAHLWESRLEQLTKTRDDYRESTRSLLHENDLLQTQVAQTEKDTVDVISFLKQEDIKKDEQIDRLQRMIKEVKKGFRKEKQQLINEYTSEIQALQESLTEKNNEVKLMQSELKLVKEFRRKRAQMQKELDDIKDHLYVTEKDHKQTLDVMERKFLEEKIRLQDEAHRKISDLAERAHSEAVSNLDETTKSIYKENVRLNEALGYHVKSAEELSVIKEKLTAENRKLKDEKEMNSLIVEEKIVQTKHLQKQVKELTGKVTDLEGTLTQVIKEHETKKSEMVHAHSRAQEKNKMEVVRLDRTLELKGKELSRMRELAKAIVNQRSELELFFLDSLEYVKGEIISNRAQYRREAEELYNKQMLAAHAGKVAFPKIRTFKDSKTSTNSIYADLKAAEDWKGLDTHVNISDLTWEQRERVLRLLFAKMNGYQSKVSKKRRPSKLPSIASAAPSAIMPPTDSSNTNRDPRPPSERAFMTETTDTNETRYVSPPAFIERGGLQQKLSSTDILANVPL